MLVQALGNEDPAPKYYSNMMTIHKSPSVRQRRPRTASMALAVLALLSTSSLAQAQGAGANVTVRAGLGVPADEYQSNCGHSSLAYSLDVQGRGRFFPQVSLAHFAGSGGGDVLCLPVAPSAGRAAGGLRLEGATSAGIGAGARAGVGPVQIEGVAQAGVIAGRHGYGSTSDDARRHVLPQVGGQASLVLFHTVVFSASANWTRLSLKITPTDGSAASTRTSWSPLVAMQVGLRVGLGSSSR